MILEHRTKVVDDSLRYEPLPEPSIWHGSDTIAIESMSNLSQYAKWAMIIQSLVGPVCIIGLGTGVLPRLLQGRHVTVIEREAAIARWFVETYPWCKANVVVRNYDGHLDEQYIAIVNDTGDLIGAPVSKYLLPGGVYLTW